MVTQAFAAYNRTFGVGPKELEVHLSRVEKMGEIIQRMCEIRLECYKNLRDRQ